MEQQRILTRNEKLEEIKRKVTIPMYFYNIIVPQMGDYYDLYPVDFDQKIVVCCPLHDEDTPSCRYYEDTNSFYCFGCQRGGDVIALHRYYVEQRITGVKPTYNEAIEYIYKYFIEGKEVQEVVQTQTSTSTLNTDKEIINLNYYRKNLEMSITADHNISLDAKKKIWRALDDIDILIDKNLVKAIDAKEYIEKIVKEAITPDTTIQDNKLKYKGVY